MKSQTTCTRPVINLYEIGLMQNKSIEFQRQWTQSWVFDFNQTFQIARVIRQSESRRGNGTVGRGQSSFTTLGVLNFESFFTVTQTRFEV